LSVRLLAPGGSPLAPTSTQLLKQVIDSSPFGPSATDDYMFSWTVPGNASTYTVSLNASQSSMSWAGARVDTQAVPLAAVPEPMSLAALGAGLVTLLVRRKRPA
jgi:hypothetical protein